MYTIKHRPDLNILEIAVSGFFTEATLAEFFRDLAAAGRSAGGPKPPASLYDYSHAAIQSQTVVALLQAMARAIPPGHRVALYSGGPLARMQARRVAAECPTMRAFADRDAAIAWLTGPPAHVTARTNPVVTRN